MKNILIITLTQIILSAFQEGKLPGEILIDKKATGNNLEENQVIFPSYKIYDEAYEKIAGVIQVNYFNSDGKTVILTSKGPT
jgi:hypothetical protein